jgi:hypothetical protein
MELREGKLVVITYGDKNVIKLVVGIKVQFNV